ncbi:hypothetical protein ACP3TJ_03895 [Desulforudis sp. 1088]
MMLVILFLIVGLAWGTATCVDHLDRALGDDTAVRAAAFERLGGDRVRIEVLNEGFVLAIPKEFKPAWSELDRDPAVPVITEWRLRGNDIIREITNRIAGTNAWLLYIFLYHPIKAVYSKGSR